MIHAMTAPPQLGPRAEVEVDEESALVARARGGDVAAFETLYRRHVDRVHGLCWRLCDGDERRADQATQDSFVRAWQKLGTFRGEAQFSTWMHRIAVNVVLGEKRLLKRWVTFEDELPAVEAAAPSDASRSDLRRDLSAALAKLPKGARAVLLLHDVEGYRHDEIAGMTGIAVGTSKAQLHRARKLMKEFLQ